MSGIQIFSLSRAREMLITDLISSPHFIRKHLYLKGEYFSFTLGVK